LRAQLRENAEDFLAALGRFAARSDAPVIVWLAPLSERATKDVALNAILEPQVRIVQAALQGIQGVHVLDDEQVCRRYPVTQDEAPLADALAHVPFSRERYAAIASALARTVVNAVVPPFKVIVVDCDNTLWQGVCAEVGADGVEVTAHHRALQDYLVRQVDAGMLLCLCSRNEPADVEAVFRHNRAMVLGHEHIVASRMNWLPKSDNIRSLVAELRLGLDSVVFLDDSPVECAEVQAHCPDVQVARIPDDATQIPIFLEHLWVLDRLGQRGEALARTQMYRQDSRREAVRAASDDFETFLHSLQLRVTIAPPGPDQWDRLVELSRRTNQFNLAAHPRPASYFHALAQDAQCLAVHVEDRFGVYGLTGVVAWHRNDGALCVDDWILSCRVLGRGVEHHVLARLGEIAARAGCEEIVFRHIPTARSAPVLAFLESAGERLPQPSGETGIQFRILAQQARDSRARQTAWRSFPPQETVLPAVTRGTRLPVGVLDLVASSRRGVAQIRSAADDADHATVAIAPADVGLVGLQKLARSIAGAALGSASPDESLVEFGMDSLQIVTLLDEAARAYCPGHDDAVFNVGLGEFLARPTLRELSLMLTRLVDGAQS
jgi:FkbH-like protein